MRFVSLAKRKLRSPRPGCPQRAATRRKIHWPLAGAIGLDQSSARGHHRAGGKLAKPDWCLLLHPEQENALIGGKDHTLIGAICESKAWDKVLDTGKADRDKNPHHQLQDYLSTLRVRFGFLTNVRFCLALFDACPTART